MCCSPWGRKRNNSVAMKAGTLTPGPPGNSLAFCIFDCYSWYLEYNPFSWCF